MKNFHYANVIDRMQLRCYLNMLFHADHADKTRRFSLKNLYAFDLRKHLRNQRETANCNMED